LFNHLAYHRHLHSFPTRRSSDLSYEDEQVRETVPYSTFTLKDADQTEYTFGQVRWNIADEPPFDDGYAIPYFLLTQIRDRWGRRSEEHTSELQSQSNLVCRLLLE